uniref:Uncharacterized protein n=1 Tax=Streptomyces avermitilis TaxID=33903 RepID=A0A499W2T6_STRAX|nr:hypothetical protein SAVMC3_89700 [Streptomyces avermitilis]
MEGWSSRGWTTPTAVGEGWQKYKVRETSEAIVGAVTGSRPLPHAAARRYDDQGRLQYVGRTTPRPDGRCCGRGLLAPARRVILDGLVFLRRWGTGRR